MDTLTHQNPFQLVHQESQSFMQTCSTCILMSDMEHSFQQCLASMHVEAIDTQTAPCLHPAAPMTPLPAPR